MAETVMFGVKRLAGMEKTLTNAQFLNRYIEGRLTLANAAYYIVQLRTQYYLEEYESAHEMVISKNDFQFILKGNLAKTLLGAIPGFLEEIEYYFYRSLNLLALTHTEEDRSKFIDEVSIDLSFQRNFNVK